MSKSRSFSIYLLKEGFSVSDALKEDHALNDQAVCGSLPEGATLYVLDNPPTPPWWRGYFKIEQELRQSLKAAIVFIPAGGRTFAVMFGNVQHNLKDTSYEYDFGIRVTLNSLDPAKLKSTDILEPNGAKRQRTQLPVDSDLKSFVIDHDATIVKSLTGKTRADVKDFFKHATGASNIRVNSAVEPAGLPDLCAKLLELYKDDSYKTNFPDVQNISPVRDPAIRAALDAELIEAVKAKSDNLALAVPDFIDYEDGLWARFAGAGGSDVYDDVYLERYYGYLTLRGYDLTTIDLDALKNHDIVLTDEDGKPRGERHPIYKSLVFDTPLDRAGETFHLCEGHWYLVDDSFVARLSTFLDPFYAVTTLPSFAHADEGAFNQACADADAAMVCLDKTSIAPKGQTAVEPCDIYELKNGQAVLHHIKISTMSTHLSHLFNQGTNAIHLLRDEDASRERLKALVKGKAPATRVDEFLKPLEDENFKIVFGIITHKDASKKSKNLPLFSRISLMRAMKDMKRMRIAAEFCFIKDESAKSAGKKPVRKKKAKPEAANDDGNASEAA
jgi:uncharacterized protein (TIGR04141 family)